MSNYIEIFKKALDGRSLRTKTIQRTFSADHKTGTNLTVDALKYLKNLPDLVGEKIAIDFIEIVANQRAVGWKSLANVVDLVMSNCNKPLEVINEIIAAMANRVVNNLDGTEPINSGSNVISAILFKHTGKAISDGTFTPNKNKSASKRKSAITSIKIQITKHLNYIDPKGRDAKILREVLNIKTNNISSLRNIASILINKPILID
jgi:hypothetical protein